MDEVDLMDDMDGVPRVRGGLVHIVHIVHKVYTVHHSPFSPRLTLPSPGANKKAALASGFLHRRGKGGYLRALLLMVSTSSAAAWDEAPCWVCSSRDWALGQRQRW